MTAVNAATDCACVYFRLRTLVLAFSGFQKGLVWLMASVGSLA